MIAEEIMEIHRQVISLAASPTSGAQLSTLPVPGASQCVETVWVTTVGRKVAADHPGRKDQGCCLYPHGTVLFLWPNPK